MTYTLKYTPRWTFDFQNGDIAINYLNIAGIPSNLYPKKYPSQLNGCDDLFVMPHAEPTWETHKNLLHWNLSNRGWIWYGCHAGSVVENLYNPLDPTERMNFLSANGLVPDNQHDDGNPPYEYLYPNDPEMQFMGVIDAACQIGAEQVFLPLGNNGWRPTTKAAVHNPTQQNIPSLSTGPAGILVYGRGMGDNNRGKVMMQAGHNMDKGNADAVAAIRAFFNYSFLSVYDKVVEPTIAPQITNIVSGSKINYGVVLPAGADSSMFTYRWSSTCGTFSNEFSQSTVFTANSVGACTPCEIMVEIADGCGREYYQLLNLQVCPVPPVAQDITTKMIINNPGTPAQKVGKDFPFAGTDADGWVVDYIILTLPVSGVLSYDHDNNSATPDVNITSLPPTGLVLTKAQTITLKYDPVDGFSDNATFTYTVADNNNLLDLTPARYTIPVNPPPVAKTFICTPAPSTTNIYNVCPMEATDEGTIVSYTIVTLPPGTQGKVYLLGVEVDPGQVLSPLQVNLLTFKPGGSYVGYAEITYTATDEKGASDQTPATLTLQLVNQPPVATDISANTITNPVGSTQVSLPDLKAVDVDGTIASYMITNVPASSEGTLYVNNLPVSNNQVLTISQSKNLKFDPQDNFSGVAKFYFTATDNDGLTDNTPATFSIPVRDILPKAEDITNNSINAAAGQTLIKPLQGSDPDSTNIITEFIITQLPAENQGILFYNNGGNYLPVFSGQELTPAQATTLKFDPQPWIGTATFKYTVRDDEGFTDPTSATFKIPVVNILPKVTNISGPSIPDTASTRILVPGLSGTDQDGTVDAFVITSLPNPAHGVLRLQGNPLSVGMMITAADAQLLEFTPVLRNANDAKFKFASVDNLLGISDKDATYTIDITLIPYKNPPVATNITHPVLNMNAVSRDLLPLEGIDSDGTVIAYRITQLPNSGQGILFVNGIAVVNNQEIPAEIANALTFVPSGTFAGNVNIKYRCIDNDALISNEATYQLPITNAKPIAKNITIGAVKKGNTTKIQGPEASDIDGTIISFRILSLPSLGTLQYDSAGTNNYVNIPVNRVITLAQSGRLRFIAGNVLGTSSFTYSGKDNMNDTSAVATYTIPVAASAGNQSPIASDINSTAISFNSGLASIAPLAATDLDGNIVSYTLASIPPPYYGTLQYNTSGSTYAPVPYGGFVVTATQATTLKFLPSGIYMGNVVVRFYATDDDGGSSPSRLLTIPLINTPPVASNITNAAIISSDGPKILSPLAATDDGSIKYFFITSLPNPATGILVLDGFPVTKQQVIPLMYNGRLEFDPNPAFTGTAAFSYSAADNTGLVDQTPATFTIPVSNDKPIAEDKLSQVITNQPGTGPQIIPALTGIDEDGSISAFFIQSLPNGGLLYKNGSLISTIPAGGYQVSTSDASKISFDPNENWSGVASFTYSASDNSNNLSEINAIYQVPVNLAPVTSNVTSAVMAPSGPKLSIPSLVGSDDGAIAFFTITELPPAYAGTLFIDNIPVTNLAQVDSLSPLQVSQMSYQPSAAFVGVIFTYTATDDLGVIDVTPAVYRIPYAALSTLPVRLLSFTGEKTGADNTLEWRTTEETNTDHFELEYSADGTNYVKIASIQARGNATSTIDYNYVHTQVKGTAAYYRLKIVDRDMEHAYSNIVMLKRTAVNTIDYSVYPNPFAEKITVSVRSETSSNMLISIFDMSGKQIKTQNVNIIRGENRINIDNLDRLTGGTYILTIKDQNTQVSTRILKIN